MMDGIIKAGGGGGRVGVGVGVDNDDVGDGMQCSNHPYRNNPGGICAFCLQEKLGKLVSSSFPLPIRGSSSSSSSSSSPPSFRSDMHGASAIGAPMSTTVHGNNHGKNINGIVNGVNASTSTSLSLALTTVRPTSARSANARSDLNVGSNGVSGGRYLNSNNQEYYNNTRRARIPFLLAKKKKKILAASSSSSSSDRAADIVFKRSKSTTTPRSTHFLDGAAGDEGDEVFSPRKRGGFWSFLHLSSSSSSSSSKSLNPTSSKKSDSRVTHLTPTPTLTTTGSSHFKSSSSLSKNIVIEEDDDSPNSQTTATSAATASSFERKVSRSRSVGCGSRSFSGDFFERISTGFGDCTLRRVESHREGKSKISGNGSNSSSNMKERVKCGGIFGGFMMTSSSSSSSSSSYWVSSSGEDHQHHQGKPTAGISSASAAAGPLVHGRSKSWNWAFASPMRAFSKPSSKDGKTRDIIRNAGNNKNPSPNLAAIPSLLAVRS